MTEAFQRASITCKATGIAGGVEINVEWFRRDHHERVKEANHEFAVDKHKGTLTILEVGKYL